MAPEAEQPLLLMLRRCLVGHTMILGQLRPHSTQNTGQNQTKIQASIGAITCVATEFLHYTTTGISQKYNMGRRVNSILIMFTHTRT